MKEIFAPHLNRNVKFGRKRPAATYGLRLGNYLRMALPPPPHSADYSPKAGHSLANVYQNDVLGDCVIAAGYHIVGVETGNAGKEFIAAPNQIVSDYSAIGGYVPGNPATDNGCMETDAFNYWTHHGFADGSKLLGWIRVDATNTQEVMAALYLFENLMFGIELPDAWISPFPSQPGFVWGVAGPPNPSNGHAIMGYGYNSSGVMIDSWGLGGVLTWSAIAKYCTATSGGELYALLTPDQLTKGQDRAPNGVAWTELISDFDQMGGNVPVPPPPSPAPPSPPPGPPPVPTPPAIVTLEQAQEWAIAGLLTGHAILTRKQAERAVLKSLATHWPKT